MLSCVQAEFPALPAYALLSRAYPYRSLLGQEGVRAVEELLSTFNISEPERPAKLHIDGVEPRPTAETAAVTISCDGCTSRVEVRWCRLGDAPEHVAQQGRDPVSGPIRPRPQG